MSRYTTPQIKYTLFPGKVNKKNDTDAFISAPQLAALYGVPFSECQVARTSDNTKRISDDTIWLYPDPSGEYVIPTRKQNGKQIEPA